MSDAIDIGEINLINSLKAMEVIGQNIANANVAGYKRDRVVVGSVGSFSDALATAANELSGGLPQLLSFTDYAQGALGRSGNLFHVGIEGPGFFVVQTPTGLAYSRAGNLSTDAHGRLLLNQRYPLLGEQGEIILTTQTPRITQSGEIYDGENLITKIRLGFPADADILVKTGETLFTSDTPLTESTTEPYSVRQGYLESSNIQQVDEMVMMMKINRQVEMTQRIIRGYDDMMGIAISTIPEF